MRTFIQNGISYSYEYESSANVLEVFDKNRRIAIGQYNDQTESFIYDYFDDKGGRLEEFNGNSPEMYYRRSLLETAEWLSATHPEL